MGIWLESARQSSKELKLKVMSATLCVLPVRETISILFASDQLPARMTLRNRTNLSKVSCFPRNPCRLAYSDLFFKKSASLSFGRKKTASAKRPLLVERTKASKESLVTDIFSTAATGASRIVAFADGFSSTRNDLGAGGALDC